MKPAKIMQKRGEAIIRLLDSNIYLNDENSPHAFSVPRTSIGHTIITGRNCAQNNSTARHIAAQLFDTNPDMRLVVFDPTNEWDKLSDFAYLSIKKYPLDSVEALSAINPLQIPEGIDPQMWVRVFVDCFLDKYLPLDYDARSVCASLLDLWLRMAYNEVDAFAYPECSADVTFETLYQTAESNMCGKEKDQQDSSSERATELFVWKNILKPLLSACRKYAKSDKPAVSVVELAQPGQVTILHDYSEDLVYGLFLSQCILAAITETAKKDDEVETAIFLHPAELLLRGRRYDQFLDLCPFVPINGSHFEETSDTLKEKNIYLFAITERIAKIPLRMACIADALHVSKISRKADVQFLRSFDPDWLEVNPRKIPAKHSYYVTMSACDDCPMHSKTEQ